jgi:hypothetical protein
MELDDPPVPLPDAVLMTVCNWLFVAEPVPFPEPLLETVLKPDAVDEPAPEPEAVTLKTTYVWL